MDAPSKIVSELNKTRVKLSETENKARVQSRKIEDLQKECALSQNKNARLEQEISSSQKDLFPIKNCKESWEKFHCQLSKAFPDYKTENPMIPPEASVIIRQFQSLQSSLT